jgi:hypothetical protein
MYSTIVQRRIFRGRFKGFVEERAADRIPVVAMSGMLPMPSLLAQPSRH